MITSNINELQFLAKVKKDELNNKNNLFLDELKNSPVNENFTTTKTNSLSFENIKGISLKEIEHIFKNEEDNQMAKNLRLATLFSEDNNLAKAMFNTVLGKPFNTGFIFLKDRYEDKHNYFLSMNSNKKLSDLLHETLKKKISDDELKPHEQISQDMLDEVLLQVNSFSFLDAFSTTTYDKYNRYKDEDNDYSFLYNDYNLQYQELIYKYNKEIELEKNIIKQL